MAPNKDVLCVSVHFHAMGRSASSNFFSNFIRLLDTLNVANANLTKKVTCIWLAYSD